MKHPDLDVFRFWAKTSEKDDAYNKGRWHSVLCHCIDAAMVARATIKRDKKLRGTLEELLGLKDEELLRFIALFVALHDVGKVCSPFQRAHDKNLVSRTSVPQELYSWLGKGYPKTTGHYRHEIVSQYVLCEQNFGKSKMCSKLLIKKFFSGRKKMISEFGSVYALHHGWFHPPGDNRKEASAGKWLTAQVELAEKLFEHLCGGQRVKLKGDWSIRAYGTLLGLLIESDWVSSDQTFFPCEFSAAQNGEVDIEQYMKTSETKAENALITLLLHQSLADDMPTFQKLFPWIQEANDLQKTIIGEVESGRLDPKRQFFVMINYPMGKGKTEAAIYLSEMAGKGEMFLLPSQATTNSIYRRRIEIMNNRLKGTKMNTVVEVSHSMRWFCEDRDMLYSKHKSMDENGDEEGSITSDFFESAKKAMLAPVCVATLDQAAIAAVRSKHMFLRIYAMADKTIIIDEVHSYGIYTQQFIFQLVKWLKTYGCNVIILSATVTAAHKQQLVEAWGSDLAIEDAKKYPNAIICQDDTTRTIPIPGEEQRSIDIKMVTSLARAIDVMLPFSKDPGFTAAVFCNTVGETQESYDAVKEKLGLQDEEIICLHAKMPLFQGKEKEEQLEQRLGLKGAIERKGRRVIIASQKCEQSLNFDCDIVISFVSPIDSLLQRLGRLHRFDLPYRPPGCEKPQAVIIDNSSDISKRMEGFGGSSYIYPIFLLRKTLEVLSGKQQVMIPSEMQNLVDSVYVNYDPEKNPARPPEENIDERMFHAQRKKEEIHGLEMAVAPMLPSEVTRLIPLDEEELGNKIRLIDPSRRIIVLFKKDRNSKDAFLDMACTRPVNIHKEETQTNDLMRNSVSIFEYQFLKTAQNSAHQEYAPWQSKPFLDKCFPEVFFPEGNGLSSNGCGMQFSPKKGLIFNFR